MYQRNGTNCRQSALCTRNQSRWQATMWHMFCWLIICVAAYFSEKCSQFDICDFLYCLREVRRPNSSTSNFKQNSDVISNYCDDNLTWATIIQFVASLTLELTKFTQSYFNSSNFLRWNFKHKYTTFNLATFFTSFQFKVSQTSEIHLKR